MIQELQNYLNAFNYANAARQLAVEAQDRSRVASNEEEATKAKLLHAMLREETENGAMSCEALGFRVSLVNKPRAVELSCEPDELPAEYQRVQVEADKKKLREWLSEGNSCNFAKLSDSGRTIRIEPAKFEERST